MGIRDWFRRAPRDEVTEATRASLPERRGFEFGVPVGGLTEYNQGLGQATQTDRRSLMQQLYEAYLACSWSWASVNAITRTITAGGLAVDWDTDDGEGDQDQPEKPPEVQALERLIRYTNPREDIRQLLRSTIADLLVFGDAYIEVSWWAGQPVALYTLDSPTTVPIADEHGVITGYVQTTEFGQRAEFDPHEVIHISLDAPRSGMFGTSPTQAALLPITAWLFTAGTLKEVFRKGNPANTHVDFPAGMAETEIKRWLAQYAARNIGPRNIGVPVATKGGASVKELQQHKIIEFIDVLNQKRDEILATYGVPPAMAGVIESGNIGGGTGESQRKTFVVNTCQPLAALVLEKLDFFLLKRGFGISGWHLKFAEVDMRDSETIEKIRDMRLRNGSWTLNRYKVDVGEPPVDGGDDSIIVERQVLIKWRDMDAFSRAQVASLLKDTGLDVDEPSSEDTPVSLIRVTDRAPSSTPSPSRAADDRLDQLDSEHADLSGLSESWRRRYDDRRRRALRELPGVDTAA